jgi:hypothetical protein
MQDDPCTFTTIVSVSVPRKILERSGVVFSNVHLTASCPVEVSELITADYDLRAVYLNELEEYLQALFPLCRVSMKLEEMSCREEADGQLSLPL